MVLEFADKNFCIKYKKFCHFLKYSLNVTHSNELCKLFRPLQVKFEKSQNELSQISYL